MLSLCVHRVSPRVSINLSRILSFPILSPSPFLPPVLSTFIVIKSKAYRGFSGLFGDFESIVFIVNNQVTSSIVDRGNSSHPKIVSPLLDHPSLSSFFSILYFLSLLLSPPYRSIITISLFTLSLNLISLIFHIPYYNFHTTPILTSPLFSVVTLSLFSFHL